MLMSATEYRESQRSYAPRVFVDDDRIDVAADEPRLAPGINAIGVTYDYALDADHGHLARASHFGREDDINRSTTASDSWIG
jgi:4-hydroxybutyryl-CoA dehydratase / vinylacetyl-CoA-Delta-isomerase